MMESSTLVRLLGFPATLIHGDPMVLDRWLFLRRNLPRVPSGSVRLVEIGCGTGAFTIGAALRGYSALGLSWDTRNQLVAGQRASICQAWTAEFEVQDVRFLEQMPQLAGTCDVVICCETIEHIIDHEKLMLNMAACLKPGGRLLLTSPNFDYKSIGGDEGPFVPLEDGKHVRRGYTKRDLEELCSGAGLRVSEVGYCSGFLSQKGTAFLRALSRIHPLFAWAVLLPCRILPPTLDDLIAAIFRWPGYSITLVAVKP